MLVRYDIIIFALVTLVSLIVMPQQGTTPSLGYNVFITMARTGKTHTFHIHHWMYILLFLIVGTLSRGMSSSGFETVTSVALALVFSEILRYSDAFTLTN